MTSIDAQQVTALWRSGISIEVICRRLHHGYPKVISVLRATIPPEEWQQTIRRRRIERLRATRFVVGQKPWNKGTHFVQGGRSAETRFKPGQLSGRAAVQWKAVGIVVIRCDKPPNRLPRRWIKVRDDGPKSRRWMPLARYMWERDHGPIPAGQMVTHIDGDTLHDDPANLMLITQRFNMLRLRQDAKAMAKRRARASKAAKARHAANRLRRRAMPTRIVYDCAACGAEVPTMIEQCPKCGSLSFERRAIA